MVLDIKLFRAEQGGDPELIRESQRRRHKPVEIVDEIIALDEKWRKDTFQLDNLRKEQRIISKQIGELNQKGNKEEAATLSKRAKDMRTEIDALIISVDQTKVLVDKKLALVGNIVHESVPVSNNEDDNALYHQFGEYNKKENANKNHRDLLHMIDGFDPVRGHKVAGHRGYFLKGMGVRLSQAVISYASDFLIQREYTLLQTPLFMKKEVMAQTAQLEQFDEELYKVVESHGEHADKEFYLIATSEQPISAYHADEWLQPNELPLRYGGISSCFRKEAGAAGKDTWGIFRVHQFDKVEQFVVTAPETSWQEHEKMMEVSEQFWQSLEIPYRVVTIVSAELNNAASKKYDLEGWFPGSGEFRELVSCSNCTDYQSRSLEVRCGTKAKEDKEKKYVHMLNSTLCALTRTICVILENHQTETGVNVPKALRNYMGGLEFMPFVLPQPPPPDQPNTVKPGDVKKAAAGAKKEGGEQKKQGGGGEQKKKEGGEQQKKQGGGEQKKKEGGPQQGKGKGQQQGKGQEKKEEKTEAKTEAKTEEKKEEKTEEKKEQAPPAEVKTESAAPKEQTTEQK